MSHEPVKEIEYNGYTINVYQDEFAENPIQEYDNQPHINIFHSRYDFGNDKRFDSPQDFQDFCEENDVVYLPVFMYDHSGITVNTTGFHCPWDSGQVGYCWVTKEEAKEWWGVEDVEEIEDLLKSTVELLDNYLTGNVYGYGVERDGEELDSCYGFYGDPEKSGLLDEAKSNADCDAAERYKKTMEQQVYAI